MSKIKIEFTDECGSTVVIKDLDGEHISHYVEAFVGALLVEGFQQDSIDRYIPPFDVGFLHDPATGKYFPYGN